MGRKEVEKNEVQAKEVEWQRSRVARTVDDEIAPSERVIRGSTEVEAEHPALMDLLFEYSASVGISEIHSIIVWASVLEPVVKYVVEVVFEEPRIVGVTYDVSAGLELDVEPAEPWAVSIGGVEFQPSGEVIVSAEIDSSLPEWPSEEPLKVYSVYPLFESAMEVKALDFPDMSLPWVLARGSAGASTERALPKAAKAEAGENEYARLTVHRGVAVADAAGSVDELLTIEDVNEGKASGMEGLLVSLVAHDRPVVIIAEKKYFEYSELLIRLLREIHRIAYGVPRPFASLNLAGALERAGELYATNSVALINVDSRELKAIIRGKEDALRPVREKFVELFSQGYGILVVYTDDSITALKEIVSMSVPDNIPPPVPAPTFTVRLKGIEITSPSYFMSVINRIWGRILNAEKPLPPYEDEATIHHIGLSAYAKHADTVYYKRLARIAVSSAVQLEVPASPEGESVVHYALKAVVYMYLKHVAGYENVGAEHVCQGMVGVLADVCAKATGRCPDVVVEVETLYGRGLPLLRLKSLVEERLAGIKGKKLEPELWIVLPPPQAAIIPRKWLERFVEWAEEKYPGRVKLFTVDVDEAVKLVRAIEEGYTHDVDAEPLVLLARPGGQADSGAQRTHSPRCRKG